VSPPPRAGGRGWQGAGRATAALIEAVPTGDGTGGGGSKFRRRFERPRALALMRDREFQNPRCGRPFIARG